MSELPKGWAKATLAQLVSPDRPRELPRDLPHLPFVGMEHVEAHSMRLLGTVPASGLKSSAVHFQADDVLYGRLRPYLNKVLLARFEGLCSAEFIVFGKRVEVSSEWLAYFLNSSAFVSFSSHLNAGDRPRVDFDQIGTYELLVAPRREQDRIVDEIEKQFTRLDFATAALKRVQANLKRYRASVLKAACEGRLVPTEAELARKAGRDYEPANKLLQRILHERRARWEADTLAKMQASGKSSKDDHWKQKYKEPSGPDTSDVPPLPEGWCWAGLEQIAIFQNGRPFPSAQYRPDGVKLLRPGNLHVSGRVVWDEKNTRCLPIAFSEENRDLIVRGKELIMNLTAQSLKDEFLGRICITDDDDASLLNQRLARITPIVAPPTFLLWVLKSWWFRRFVDQLNTGSLIQHMFTSQLAEFTVALPPLAEQERISEAVDRQLSTLNVQEGLLDRTHSRSAGLRQAVLVAAFTGQLVPQDPTDEPASVLLQRIRAERNAFNSPKAGRRSRKEPAHA